MIGYSTQVEYSQANPAHARKRQWEITLSVIVALAISVAAAIASTAS